MYVPATWCSNTCRYTNQHWGLTGEVTKQDDLRYASRPRANTSECIAYRCSGQARHDPIPNFSSVHCNFAVCYIVLVKSEA